MVITKEKAVEIWGAAAEQAKGLAHDDFLCLFANFVLEAAKQRNLELLAVIEKQSNALNEIDMLLSEAIAFESMSVGTFTKQQIASCKAVLSLVLSSDTVPSQALREYEANVLEELLDTFAFFQTEEGLWLANAIRRMAEERRKK